MPGTAEFILVLLSVNLLLFKVRSHIADFQKISEFYTTRIEFSNRLFYFNNSLISKHRQPWRSLRFPVFRQTDIYTNKYEKTNSACVTWILKKVI